MHASAVGKMEAEVGRAYLAGLIDGDGAVSATIERHPEKKFGFRVRVVTKNDLIKQARLADTLSRFNVRSKNRRKNFATMI